MVVLMGSENAPNEEKDMVPGSKEQILYSALSMVCFQISSRNQRTYRDCNLENVPSILEYVNNE